MSIKFELPNNAFISGICLEIEHTYIRLPSTRPSYVVRYLYRSKYLYILISLNVIENCFENESIGIKSICFNAAAAGLTATARVQIKSFMPELSCPRPHQ